MRSGANKKRKSVVIFILVLLVCIAVLSYIWASTYFIDEASYRERVYASLNYSSHIIDCEEAEVTLVKIADEPCITPNILAPKVNRYLLILNGGYAVKVVMHTDVDGLLGPVILYYNPFTKQYIGGAPRF